MQEPKEVRRQWSGSLQDILFPPQFRLRPGNWQRYSQAVRLTSRLYGVEGHLHDSDSWEARNVFGVDGRLGVLPAPDWEAKDELCKAIVYFNIEQTHADEWYLADLTERSASSLFSVLADVYLEHEVDGSLMLYLGSPVAETGWFCAKVLAGMGVIWGMYKYVGPEAEDLEVCNLFTQIRACTYMY